MASVTVEFRLLKERSKENSNITALTIRTAGFGLFMDLSDRVP